MKFEPWNLGSIIYPHVDCNSLSSWMIHFLVEKLTMSTISIFFTSYEITHWIARMNTTLIRRGLCWPPKCWMMISQRRYEQTHHWAILLETTSRNCLGTKIGQINFMGTFLESFSQLYILPHVYPLHAKVYGL